MWWIYDGFFEDLGWGDDYIVREWDGYLLLLDLEGY